MANIFANAVYDPAKEDPNSNEAQAKHATSVLGALGKVGRLLMDLGVTNTTGVSPSGKNWQRGDQMPTDPQTGFASVGSPQQPPIPNDPAADEITQLAPRTGTEPQAPAQALAFPQPAMPTPQPQPNSFSTLDARGNPFSTSVAPGVVQDDSFKRAMQGHVNAGTQGPIESQGNGIPTGPQAPQTGMPGTTSGTGMARLGSDMALEGMDNPLGRFGIQQAMNDEMMGKENWMRAQNIGAAGGMIDNATKMSKMVQMPAERETAAMQGVIDELQWTQDPVRRQTLTMALDEMRKRLTGYGIPQPTTAVQPTTPEAPQEAQPGLGRAAVEGALPGVAGGLAWTAAQGLRAAPNPIAKAAGYILPAIAGWGTDKAIQSLDPQAEAARTAHPIAAAGSAALGSMLGLRGRGAKPTTTPAASGTSAAGVTASAPKPPGKPPTLPKKPLGRTPVPPTTAAKPPVTPKATVQSITPPAEQAQIKAAAQGFGAAGTNAVAGVQAVNVASKAAVAKSTKKGMKSTAVPSATAKKASIATNPVTGPAAELPGIGATAQNLRGAPQTLGELRMLDITKVPIENLRALLPQLKVKETSPNWNDQQVRDLFQKYLRNPAQ